jgi:type I restriction enzyme S subunit
MTESKTKPEIRFAGFTDAWEQRELGELFQIYSGQTPYRGNPENFDNPTTAWIKTMDLNNSTIVLNDEDVSDKAAEQLKVLPVGTILIAMYGGFNQIGRTGMLTYPATINQAISALPPISEIDSYYLITELNHKVGYWKRIAASSRKDPNITKNDVESYELSYPTLEEQKKISKLFSALDRLLTLHQREYNKTVNIKKAMLEKMFPKDGEDKPEIRFTGFTDAWEQRKLGELFENNNERNEGQFPVERTISIAAMRFNPSGNGADDSSLASYKVLRVGDIAFEGHTSKEFAFGRFVMNDIGNGIMSPRFSTLRPKFVPVVDFWKYYIHYEPIMKPLLVQSTKSGTMMNELVVSDLLTKTILVPKEAEQARMGEFFASLDHLITLHQRELGKLQNMKKALLDKMFV